MGTVIFVIIVIGLIVDFVIANFMMNVAYAKGYDDSAHAFALCFILGIMGVLYVVALPDLVVRENQKKMISLLSSNPSAPSGTAENMADQLPNL